MTHTYYVPLTVIGWLLLAVSGWAQPNVVWLSAEDLGLHLGCYGDPLAKTPHLDRLAQQGVLYRQAFVPAPVCAPCRSSIITGVMATTLGTSNMRSLVTLPDEIRCFPAYLRDAGYFCTNNSKTDYQFDVPPGVWDESGEEAHWQHRAADDQPFFAVFNFLGTHESRVRGDRPVYEEAVADLGSDQWTDPDSVTPPPFHPNTAAVRGDWARYYNTIAALDNWVGRQLADLEKAGVADNTIVIFWTDHGVGLPRGKRWLYDSGLQVPLIVRAPQAHQDLVPHAAGTSTHELVSLVDLGPTVLNLAGIDIPETMQGRAFLGRHLTPQRTYIYAFRDRMDERYDSCRAVREGRFKYIRNYTPWKPYSQQLAYAEIGATMREMRRLEAAEDLDDRVRLFFRSRKPVEELYDTADDPYELRNLADAPEHNETLTKLRSVYREWHLESGDIALLPEVELQRSGQAAGSRYQILQQAGASEFLAQLHHVADIASRGPADEASLAELRELSQHDDASIRFWAAHGLGFKHGMQPAAMRELERLLQDRDACVRLAAAEQLGQLHHPDGIAGPILEALTDDDYWVRLHAANVLDPVAEFVARSVDLRPLLVQARDHSFREAREMRLAPMVAHIMAAALARLGEQ